VELYLHFTNTSSWRSVQLKHKDNFAFTIYMVRADSTNNWTFFCI